MLPEDVVSQLVEDAVTMSPDAKRGWLEVGMAEDIRPALTSLAADETAREMKIRVVVGSEDKVETVGRVQSETVDVLRSMGLRDVAMRVVEGCGHLMTIEAAGVIGEEVGALLK